MEYGSDLFMNKIIYIIKAYLNDHRFHRKRRHRNGRLDLQVALQNSAHKKCMSNISVELRSQRPPWASVGLVRDATQMSGHTLTEFISNPTYFCC